MNRRRLEVLLGGIASLALVVGSWQRLIPYSLTETLGFVTGAVCVYLVVKESVWNFPVGLANNFFFIILFANARLFGDAALQVVYIALGIQGWYLWLYGGRNRTALKVARAPARLLIILSVLTLVVTIGLALVLRRVRGSLPILDSLTTVLSLAAQYLLNKKYVENWYAWITADLIYVYIYVSKGLHLTAILYLVFLGLCLAGVRSWWVALRKEQTGATPLRLKGAIP